jgi:hypothetical protein
MRLALTFVVASFLATAPALARADDGIIITPQQPMLPGNGTVPSFVDASEVGGLTNSTSPSFLIQAPAGTLQCNVSADGMERGALIPCGSPPASCPGGSTCALLSFPAFSGLRVLSVSDDPTGSDFSDSTAFAFEDDQTPPGITFDGLTVPELYTAGQPPGPTVYVRPRDDASLEPDTIQCAITTAGAAPVWAACPPAPSGAGSYDTDHIGVLPYPKRHVDYTFQARAVDAFGRMSTPFSLAWNPQPCVVRATGGSLTRLIRSDAVPMSVSCDDAGGGFSVSLLPLGTNGQYRSIAKGEHYPPFSTHTVRNKAASFRTRTAPKLNLPRASFNGVRAIRLLVEVDPDGGEHPALAAVTFH